MAALTLRCYNVAQGNRPAMDTDYPIDLGAVFDVIDCAEVITFRFVTIPQRLLFDTRHNEMEGPLLKLMPRAASLEERFRAIKRLRPRFRPPEKISAIWWPKYVHSLADCGAWGRILGRIGSCGYPQIADRGAEVLREMERREQAEMYSAITGAGYHALWERPPEAG
jgi:hypothetical protein